MSSKRWAFVLLLATASGACLKPRAPDAPSVAGVTTAVASPTATGKYGEVQGVQLVSNGVRAF